MAWWIWVLLGFLLLALEVTTLGLHLAFFGIGALAVGAMVGLGWSGPLWLQWLAFTLISIIALLLLRSPLLKALRRDHSPAMDTLVGETATTILEIGANEIGKVELRGTSWSARNIGSDPIPPGKRCRVEHVEGLVLQIRPQ